MRVFVTGASGYIGHAVAKAFRAKGHTVFGLVRTEEDASLLSLDEIWPVIGGIENPDSYRHVLNEVEVAVHCAFDSSEKGIERDAMTIDTILEVFTKSALPRSFIYTSGVWVYGSMGYAMADESMPLNPIDIIKWRPSHEEKVLNGTTALLRTVIIRPGHAYGNVGGLTNLLFASLPEGAVHIVGEGHNRVPLVHVQDLAHAYVSAAEKEVTRVVLNVVDDSTATIREIAEAVASAANLAGKIEVMSIEEGEKQYGAWVNGMTMNLTVNNSRVKRLLGWQIHHAPFINDVTIYYNAWQAAQQTDEF